LAEQLSDRHPTLLAVGASGLIGGFIAAGVVWFIAGEFSRWVIAPVILGVLLFIGTAWVAVIRDQHQRRTPR